MVQIIIEVGGERGGRRGRVAVEMQMERVREGKEKRDQSTINAIDTCIAEPIKLVVHTLSDANGNKY